MRDLQFTQAFNELLELMEGVDPLSASQWVRKDGFNVKFDVQKLAEAILDAGYRKAEL